MAGEMEDFATLTLPEKLSILGRGGLLQLKNWSAAHAHDKAPDRDLREFRSKPRYQLPNNRVDRNELDAAMNYSGGYDFANQPGVSVEDAIDLAKAYQLRDYMMARTPARELDAKRDFGENVAGIVSAQQPVPRAVMMKNAADYGRNVGRYAKGGLIQMKDGGQIPSEDELAVMSQSDLLDLRRRYTDQKQQEALAPYEHRAFAREAVTENPLSALGIVAGTPVYAAGKALGVLRGRTPASLEQVRQGFVGSAEGLKAAFDKFRN